MSPQYFSGFQSKITLALGLLVLTSIGCDGGPPGKPSGSATITVTFGGQPVTEGMVSLQNASGEGGGSPLNSAGVATIPVVTKGSYVVTITPPIGGVAPPEPGKTLAPQKEYANIPAKFRRTESSPLKAEIKNDKNDLKFELQP